MTGDGSPSPGWWRSGNGEWYPPELLPPGWRVGPDGVPRSFEWAPIVASPRPPTMWGRIGASYRLWPVWAKFVPPVAALMLAGTAVAMVGREGDGGAIVGATSTSTRGVTAGSVTTSATTRRASPAPTPSVAGLVITAPSIGATSSTAGSASTASATTATTTSSTRPPTTTVPAISGSTTTTTTAPTTTVPSTSSSTTTVPTTTQSPTTTRPTTTTQSPTTTRPTTTTTTRAPITHTVNGTLLVDSRVPASINCGGTGSLAGFQNGQTIALSDANGRVVGHGVLTNCRWTDWRFVSGTLTAKPEFSFTITGVVEVSSYTARSAGMTWRPVTLNSLRNAGWRLDLVAR